MMSANAARTEVADICVGVLWLLGSVFVPEPRTNAEAAIEFFGLQSCDDPLRWRLPVTLGLCGATGTLHGGCALAAVVAALETVTDRSLASATSQYLSRVVRGETALRQVWEIGLSGRTQPEDLAIEVDVDHIRLLGDHLAVVDVVMTFAPATATPAREAFVMVMTRDNDRWRIASARAVRLS
jgi:hypothetical protein